MRKILILLSIATLFSCSNNKLEKGSAEYELATKLAEKVPAFNPDENLVIATTNSFDVNIADIIQKVKTNFGSQADKLTTQSAENLKRLLTEFAQGIAITKIILREAENDNIVVTESQIDSALEKQYERYGGKEKFIESAKQNGIDELTIREDFRIGETHRLYIEFKKKEMSIISEEEIIEALNGDQLASVRHILISTQGKTEEEKVALNKKALDLLEKAKAGEDFAELAQNNTDDPSSKTTGGLYENFPRGQMVKPFDEASFTIPIGEISDIVETQYGYHIIKVIERKKEERPREVVVKELEKNKARTVVNDIYEDLKNKYEFKMNEIS